MPLPIGISFVAGLARVRDSPNVPEFWELRFMIHLLRKSFTGIEKAVLGFLVAGNFRAI